MIASVALLVAAMAAEWKPPPFLNVSLNVITVIGLLGGLVVAVKAFRSKTMEGELKERDRIVQMRTQLAEAAEAARDSAAGKAAELGGLLDTARSDAAAWQARYEEQSNYTAGPALEAIEKLLSRNNEESERRHREMLLALRALRQLVPGRPALPVDADDLDGVA